MYLSPLAIAFIVLGLAVVIGLIVMWNRNRHSAAMRAKFGPEYDEVVTRAGGTYRGEGELHAREERVARFNILPLSESRRSEFVAKWQNIQTLFVDDPAGAATRGDLLLGEVMQERGYPVADFDQRAADLSVDHPEVVQNYRAGHDIALSHARKEATTEDLRQAMIHYRALFDDLVNEPAPDMPARPINKQRLTH